MAADCNFVEVDNFVEAYSSFHPLAQIPADCMVDFLAGLALDFFVDHILVGLDFLVDHISVGLGFYVDGTYHLGFYHVEKGVVLV